jgi:hypothetical protein
MPTVLHIDGLSTEPTNFTVEQGETLGEVLDRMGATVRTEHVPGPTPLQEAAERAQEVGAEVSVLLRECRRWEDVPAPEHPAWPDDDCVACDARRIVSDMLD